jgi:hypothetical protein
VSVTSFKAFSIENYAEHIKQSSSVVYKKFEEKGLLKMLETDYGDLHGMSFEYLMQFFDEYLKEEK